MRILLTIIGVNNYFSFNSERVFTLERSELEVLALMILRFSKIPVGAGTMNQELRLQGMNIGEATAGRLLKELQNRGLAEKVGSKGRILSAEGREYLHRLELERERELPKNIFYLSLQAQDAEVLGHILEARRAVEKEAARLAALRATDEDIAFLETLLKEQSLINRKRATEVNEQFHFKVAECSKNPVLVAAITLIRQELKWAPVLGALHSQISLNDEDYSHERIVQTIKGRDPAAAEKAMADHIDRYRMKIRQHMIESSNPGEPYDIPGQDGTIT